MEPEFFPSFRFLRCCCCFVSGNYDLQCPDKVSTCNPAIPAAEAIFHRINSAAGSLELSQHRPTVSGYRTTRKTVFLRSEVDFVSIPRCNSINEASLGTTTIADSLGPLLLGNFYRPLKHHPLLSVVTDGRRLEQETELMNFQFNFALFPLHPTFLRPLFSALSSFPPPSEERK